AVPGIIGNPLGQRKQPSPRPPDETLHLRPRSIAGRKALSGQIPERRLELRNHALGNALRRSRPVHLRPLLPSLHIPLPPHPPPPAPIRQDTPPRRRPPRALRQRRSAPETARPAAAAPGALPRTPRRATGCLSNARRDSGPWATLYGPARAASLRMNRPPSEG